MPSGFAKMIEHALCAGLLRTTRNNELARGGVVWLALTDARRASLNLKASQVEDRLGR